MHKRSLRSGDLKRSSKKNPQVKRTEFPYKIKVAAKAKRELKSLSKLDKLSIAEIIEELKENPFIGKPLFKELIGKYSYRVGLYRVIYKINQEDRVVEVLSAGHRSVIYQ